MHADIDPRLKNAIAFRDDVELGINKRTIQRVSHRADHALSCIPRQLRIRIQRDYVANLREQFFAGRDHHEAGVARSAQQSIELAQLAPLSFPANPFAFGLAPLPAPVK